ncbi:GntR family transcriptional regulator [Streptomyces kronopolitis]|uniref:GntR family transcriptional regulator n=1 Tax=Streptomyces kronopolitis TaxID=1612435 RepID=UPI0020BE15BD|nr:GntR family transcriptional regulator [Streptomyces kronopolitis]MCL6297601.1 GntR family transcriptional regulator [Streptomyces kronopolitis]
MSIEIAHNKHIYVWAVPAIVVTIERPIIRIGNASAPAPRRDTKSRRGPSTTPRPRPPRAHSSDSPKAKPCSPSTDCCPPAHTETRALHRMLIPFAIAANEADQLGEVPDTEPEQIYAILTAAGHKLTWDETVSARMPLPDERTTLQNPDVTPIVHATRVTLGTDQRPLPLKDLHASTNHTQLAYRITADSPCTLRAV